MSTQTASQPVVFSLLDEKYCVAKLPPGSPMPDLGGGSFWSLSVSDEEISIVCEETMAPEGAAVERNWRAIRVQGPLEFSLKGVLVSLLQPLADAQISVFAISTYNTDYILVPQYHLANALQALELAGHRITPL